MSSGVCSSCGNEYIRLGQHLAMSSCPYPPVGDEIHRMITGFLMGDCSVQKSGERAKNAALQSNITNTKFLDWIDQEFGVLSNGYSLFKTSQDIYEEAKETGFFGSLKSPDEYKPIYHWTSMRHPEFNRYEGWYTDDGKRFPDDLEIEPDVLRYWYVSDGTKYDDNRDNGRPYISIAATNEVHREDFLVGLFEEIGVEAQPTHSVGWTGEPQFSLRFRVDDSEFLWGYMGDPLPGFEYKWP